MMHENTCGTGKSEIVFLQGVRMTPWLVAVLITEHRPPKKINSSICRQKVMSQAVV